VGAKAELQTTWFRIYGLPVEKRSEKRVAYVASLVGIPLEVDKHNLKRWDYVRVKIGCRDISKVPATVEGLLDLHFFTSISREKCWWKGGPPLGTLGLEMLTDPMRIILHQKRLEKERRTLLSKGPLVQRLDRVTP
jgi:hypothetical protein